MDPSEKVHEACLFAESFEFNPRNTESQWYIVWGGVCFYLVGGIPHCHVAPQLEIADLPTEVLEKIASFRQYRMLDDDDVLPEGDPDDLDSFDPDLSLGALSIATDRTVTAAHKKALIPDYVIIFIRRHLPPGVGIKDFLYLVICEIKPATTRHPDSKPRPKEFLTLAIYQMEDQIALAFHTQPQLKKLYGIAASGDVWLSRIYTRDEERLKLKLQELNWSKKRGDDRDYHPLAGVSRVAKLLAKKDGEFIQELLSTKKTLGTDESGAQLLVIKDFISNGWSYLD